MTPKQRETLVFIDKFWKKRGYSPNYLEIMGATKQKSRSGVQRLVHGLADGGYITVAPGKHRGIKLGRKSCPHCGGQL